MAEAGKLSPLRKEECTMKTRFITARRKFLKNAVAFGGYAALLGIIRPIPAGLKKRQQQRERSGQGYRLTEHVKKYYETAQL
jgi:hypothetical protein